MGEVISLLGEAVRQLTVLGMAPTVRNHRELRRIGREKCSMDARAIELTQPTGGFLVPLQRSQISSSGGCRWPRRCWTTAKPSSPVRCDAAREQETPKRFGTGDTVRAPVPDRRSWRSQLAWRGGMPRGAQGRRTVGCRLKPV